MKDYVLFMHGDAPDGTSEEGWAEYLARLRASGRFAGGSSIGAGACYTKAGAPKAITRHLLGYLRVQAEDLEAARRLLEGNPVYEAGGTVEIRELPRDD